MVYISLIQNIGLIIALSVVHGLITRNLKSNRLLYPLVFGLLFGVVAVIGMKNPVVIEKGVIFDGRSIVISIAGMFGGPIPAFISALMAAIVRFMIGGGGTLMGISVITESAILGTIMYYLRKKYSKAEHPLALYLFGLAVHIVMVALMITLPGSLQPVAFKSVAPIVLIVYPIATLVICTVFLEMEKRIKAELVLEASEEKYRRYIQFAPHGIFSFDRNGILSNTNHAFSEITGYNKQELNNISLFDLFPEFEKQKVVRFLENLEFNKKSQIELQYKKKNGDIGWVSIESIKLEDQYLGFMVDLTERKKTELALEESEKAYRKQFDESSVVMLLVDPETGKIIDGNQAAIDFYGYTKEELQNLYIFSINTLPPEIIKEKMKNVKNVKGGKFLFKHKLANGEIRDVEVSSTYLQIGNREVIHSIIFDVSDKRKAEESLRINEERLKLALEAAQDGIWDWQEDESLCYFNDKYYEMLGYEPQEFESSVEFWASLIHPDDKEHTMKVNFDCLNNLIDDFQVEYRIKKKNGEYLWVLGKGKAVSRDATGKATRIIGTHTDIHERKLAQLALAESEKLYRTLFNNASEAIFIAQDERIIFANPATAKTAGLPLEKIIGKHITDFAFEEDKANILENHYKILNREIPRNDADIKYNKANGEIGWSRTSAVYIEWNGRPAVLKFGSDITDIKRAEAELIESQKKYRFLFENAGESILVVQDFKIVIANPKASEFTGIPLDKLIGMNILDFSAPGEKEKNKERIEKILSGEIKKDVRELKIQNARGEIIWINANAIKIEWEGKPAVLMFDVDITDIKKAQIALAESEEKYRFLIDNIRVIIWQMSGDLVFTFVNKYAEELLGYSPNEMIGHSVFDFVTDKSKELILKKIEETNLSFANNDYTWSDTSIFELEFVSKNGEIKIVEIKTNPIFKENYRLVGLFGFARDITASKKAEIELQKKTQELETYFNSAIDLLCLATTDGYFLKLNPEWENTLGYKISDLINVKFLDLVHPDDIPATLEALKVLSTETAIMSFTNRYRHKDGSYRWLEWRSRPVKNLIYAVARDITDRKKAEEERIAMERQMLHVQKLESLGVLAGGMAHDFNNILMAVLGHAELALDELPPNSPARESIIEIEKAARRASELSRQMLAYSGRGKFVVEQINLESLVLDMIHLLKASISKKANLRLNLDKTAANIEGDITQIRQVLMNLITNASDALEDNPGIISISTGTIYCTKDYLSESLIYFNQEPGYYSYFEVSDTGCGMSKDTITRIFEPFFTTKFTGRGLGMAAVLGIVRGHKGAIHIYSELGKGSTFKILFPAVFETVEKEKTESSPTMFVQDKSGIILLVDDEDYVRDIGSRMISKLGYEVITAVDGIDACEKYRELQDKIKLVLLDLTMPRQDGEETYRELRKLNPNLKVILTSGFTEQEITSRFAGKGLTGFIQKPFSLKDLSVKLQELLNTN